VASNLKGMIRGAVPLARHIFGDESKRKLIPELQKAGWPIITVAGKPAGFGQDLDAKAAAVRKSARSAQKRA